MLGQAGAIRSRLRGRRAGPAAILTVPLLTALVTGPGQALAVSQDSPEVKKLVDSGLAYLSEANDARLGAKCLIALAFLKAERRDSPKIQEALYACREAINANTEDLNFDVYSNGLAPIFLCELAPQQYTREIEWFLNRMKKRQKDHGGWG